MPFERRFRKKVRAGGIDVVTPRIAMTVTASARGTLPFGFGRQTHGPSDRLAQPRAIGDGVGAGDERHGMAAAIARRVAIAPGIRRGELAKIRFLRRGDNERHLANRRRVMLRRAHESRVLRMRNRVRRDGEGIDVDAMRRPLVLVAIIRPHHELTGRYANEPGDQFFGHSFGFWRTSHSELRTEPRTSNCTSNFELHFELRTALRTPNLELRKYTFSRETRIVCDGADVVHMVEPVGFQPLRKWL